MTEVDNVKKNDWDYVKGEVQSLIGQISYNGRINRGGQKGL